MKKACLFAGWLGLGLLSTKVLSVGPGAIQNARSVLRSAQAGEDGEIKGARVFLGQVIQADGHFVLQNAANKTAFALDTQERAKPFRGMTVKVTGKLDAQSHLIHVVDIQAV